MLPPFGLVLCRLLHCNLHVVVYLLMSYCFFQLVHFVNRDSLGLANDFLSLGFIPEGVDIQLVSEALQASFGDGTRQSQDFQVCFWSFYSLSGLWGITDGFSSLILCLISFC